MIYLWLLIIIVLVIIKSTTRKTNLFLWFIIGASCGLFLAYFKINWLIQIGVFVLSSISTFIILNLPVKEEVVEEPQKQVKETLVGQPGIVVSTIGAMVPGEVKVLKTIWKATDVNSHGIIQGSYIKVVGVKADQLIVQKADEKVTSKSRYKRHFGNKENNDN